MDNNEQTPFPGRNAKCCEWSEVEWRNEINICEGEVDKRTKSETQREGLRPVGDVSCVAIWIQMYF